MPLVTIGVPFYNVQNYIVETLESIKIQTYPNIQLIIVDDCSTDNSLSVVNNWIKENKYIFSEIILIENKENKGTSFSCKKLEESAQGIFFCKLDADDLISSNKIATQVEFLLENQEVALVYSNTLLIDSCGKLMQEDYFDVQNFLNVIDKVGPSGFLFDHLFAECFIPNSSVMIRKNILSSIGGYDASLFTEDWDLWLRLSKQHPIAFMEGYFSSYRIHPQSVMRQNSTLAKMYRSCCKAVLKHGGVSKKHDKLIAKHLYTYTIGMYRLGTIDNFLLRENLSYNKTFKSALYFVFGMLNLKLHQKNQDLNS